MLTPEAPLTPQQLLSLHPVILAHAGDAVYELYVRTLLCPLGYVRVNDLHRATVRAVCAPAQAAVYRLLEPLLTPEEQDIYRRGRNTHHTRIAHGSTPGEYASATGLEALFGWLCLSGQSERCDELFRAARPLLLELADADNQNTVPPREEDRP